MSKFVVVILLCLFVMMDIASAVENDIFEVEAEGIYQMGEGTSVELAKEVALFNAQRKAVDLAGRYLSSKGLIQVYQLKRDEIYSLAAREIQTEIIEQNQKTAGMIKTYIIRIRAQVQASDFVKAEMEDIAQEKDELKESFKKEMEQPVPAKIDPALDIAKAFRLLRQKKWRIAIIYLDHLEKKYPNWDSIYMAKAIGYYILHEPVFMKKALNEGCRLGNYRACDDLKNIKRLNEHDFGTTSVD